MLKITIHTAGYPNNTRGVSLTDNSGIAKSGRFFVRPAKLGGWEIVAGKDCYPTNQVLKTESKLNQVEFAIRNLIAQSK